jgi:glycosyltransferase involved in cell wall biosynthesis
MNEFKKAKQWLRIATATPMPDTTIITLPRDMKSRALEVSYHLNLHEGKLDLALDDAKKLAEIMRNDKFAQDRLKATQQMWFDNKASQSIVYLGKYLETVKEPDKIPSLINSIPTTLEGEKFVAEMRHLFLPPRIWEKDEITILCGPGFEEWSPKSIQTGIGGSEEAVINMSRELAKLGWRVTVYGNPGKDAGMYEGVKYTTWHNLNPKDQFNALILWRGIGFVEVAPKSLFTMLWMHDVPNNADFTKERLEYIDKIAVLSDYHKSLFRMAEKGIFKKMPAEKLFSTANGINPINLEKWEGNPHRMIYMSSPDRGLVYLLRNWKDIRAEVPDAELHIFYGFNVFDAIHRDNPGKREWKEKLIKMMKQEGITYHDRVGHDALNYEISQSAIWAYPTDFTEISCISAMKAQANGAIPVVTDYAALKETVKNGIRMDVDITTPEGQKEYFKELIGLLKDPERQAEMRKTMMPWAQKYFLWSNVARLWDELIRLNLQNPTRKYELPPAEKVVEKGSE